MTAAQTIALRTIAQATRKSSEPLDSELEQLVVESIAAQSTRRADGVVEWSMMTALTSSIEFVIHPDGRIEHWVCAG